METGLNLGRIIDAEITREGQIVKISIEPRSGMKKIFRSEESVIEFSRIVKIGSDVILIK